MPFFRALLSAFTLFGGHFLNRRFDRVRLIGVLLGLTLLTLITLVGGLVFVHPAFEYEHFTLITILFGVQFVLVAALVVLSAVLTFRDARQRSDIPSNIWMRVTGTALSFVGALLAAVMLLASGARFTSGVNLLTRSHTDEPGTPYEPVRLNVFFGGGIAYPDGEAIATWSRQSIPTPPRGHERLRGRVTLDGAGVKGLELSLVLNSKYEARKIETDSMGIFEVPLPAGNWLINSIHINRWDDKPRDRDLLLFSDHDPTNSTSTYNDGGLKVALPLAPGAMAVELEIRETIAITWPPHTEYQRPDTARNLPEATYSTGAISWLPVNGASEYEVEISHVTRTPNSASTSSFLRRRLNGTSLPFNSLPQRVKPQDAPPDEYEVHISAFDETGRIVTESEASFERPFWLTGPIRLGKEE